MHFYALMDAMLPAALRFDAASDIDARGLLLGTLQPKQAIEFKREKGHKAFDLMGETYGMLRLISPAFRDVLTSSGFSGWTTFPVHLDADGLDLAGFAGLSVTGRSGVIDRSRSTIVERLGRGDTRSVLYAEVGLFPEEDTWDGSDLFIPSGTSVLCVLPRVKDALSDAGITNVRFISNETYEVSLHRTPPR